MALSPQKFHNDSKVHFLWQGPIKSAQSTRTCHLLPLRTEHSWSYSLMHLIFSQLSEQNNWAMQMLMTSAKHSIQDACLLSPWTLVTPNSSWMMSAEEHTWNRSHGGLVLGDDLVVLLQAIQIRREFKICHTRLLVLMDEVLFCSAGMNLRPSKCHARALLLNYNLTWVKRVSIQE